MNKESVLNLFSKFGKIKVISLNSSNTYFMISCLFSDNYSSNDTDDREFFNAEVFLNNNKMFVQLEGNGYNRKYYDSIYFPFVEKQEISTEGEFYKFMSMFIKTYEECLNNILTSEAINEVCKRIINKDKSNDRIGYINILKQRFGW